MRARTGAHILHSTSISVLVRAHNEERHIAEVITTMPDYVDRIIVVDDASTDRTGEEVARLGDPRVTYIRHETNLGPGATLADAYRAALDGDTEVMVTMDGDGQMDPRFLPDLLTPILEEGVDFTKGNRLFSASSHEGMPFHRLFGNHALTWLTRIATGYWHLTDSQNGFTAMRRSAAEAIDWDSIVGDYSVENDVLARLAIAGRTVRDIHIVARYGEEISGIRLSKVIPAMLRTLAVSWWRRVVTQRARRARMDVT